jgi:hypothetical protein
MDSIFGSGAYVFHVNGFSINLFLTGDAYPNVPVLTLTGGNWVNGKYVVDPAQPVTITTNAFTAYGTNSNDRIALGALVPGLVLPFQEIAPWSCAWIQACQYAADVPGSNTLSYTIPANTLVAGNEYLAAAVFTRVVDRYNPGLTGTDNFAYYHIQTKVTIKAQSPIFPMTVTSNIGATVSSATATVTPRPQDAGGKYFVFAVAPATSVKNALMEKSAQLGMTAKGSEKDAPVQCVLAQLNLSGQLQAVSASALQAYVTGVTSGQSQALTILDNTPTANVAGAAFYVGIGPDASSMMASGVNRRAVSVPGSVACDPQTPQTGWWWNPNEGGRGYSIEVSGNTLFLASYLYDVTGRATWLIAAGGVSLDGSLFTGHNLENYSGGQSLSGSYKQPAGAAGGAITLAFNDASHGTMIWPGGTVAIERFNIVPNGLTLAPQNNQPESGWWWNPAESGRGFFLEWQGGQLFMAGYMYDDSGNPIWYLSGNSTPSSNLQGYSNTWQLYGNGQTLTGSYVAPTQVNANVAPVTIQFQGAESAIMTLPGGRTTAIRRYRF